MSQSEEGGASGPVRVVLTTLVFGMLAWAWLAEIDIVVTAKGRVVTAGRLQVVQAPLTATLENVLARDGQAVQVGQVLAQLDAVAPAADLAAAQQLRSQLQAELDRLLDERTGAIITQVPANAYEQVQRELQRARERAHSERREELQAQVESRQMALTAGESVLAGLRARLAIASEKVVRARPYVDVAVPRFQFLQWSDDVVVLERELAVQEQRNLGLAKDVDAARQQFRQAASVRDTELATEIAARRTRLAQQDNEIAKLSKRLADTTVRAPVEGVVQWASSLRPGAAVPYGEPLFKIAPSGEPLIVEIDLSSADRGDLRPGQAVDVKLDAFPFQHYGRLNGTLVWVSPDAERQDASFHVTSASGTVATGYVYRGQVRTAPHPRLQLMPGLTAQVDIKTQRRRVIDFFLFPIQRAVEDGMRVR